jgi:hypothetical protein
MRKTNKKLFLDRQTIRHLDLERAAAGMLPGGGTLPSLSIPSAYTCMCDYVATVSGRILMCCLK